MIAQLIRKTIVVLLDHFYKRMLVNYIVAKRGDGFVLFHKTQHLTMAVSGTFVVFHYIELSKFITYTKFFHRIVDDRWDGEDFTVQDITFNPYGRLQVYLETHYAQAQSSPATHDDLFHLGEISVMTPYNRKAPWAY